MPRTEVNRFIADYSDNLSNNISSNWIDVFSNSQDSDSDGSVLRIDFDDAGLVERLVLRGA